MSLGEFQEHHYSQFLNRPLEGLILDLIQWGVSFFYPQYLRTERYTHKNLSKPSSTWHMLTHSGNRSDYS